MYKIIPLFDGFPARSSRGYLGWSSAFLIKIKKNNLEKNLLYDTAGYNERQTLVNLLKDNYLNCEDIDGIIVSHLHFDHVVNWTLFPQADVYINKLELIPDSQFRDYCVPDFHREKLLEHSKLHFVSDGDSVEGLEVVELPGHTQGLIGLRIKNTYIVSDAIKNRKELHGGSLTNTWDEIIARQTINKVAKQAEVIYPGHDVPLIKKDDQWVAANDAEETITFMTPDLVNVDGYNSLQIKISSEL